MTYEKALVLLGPLLCGRQAMVSQEPCGVLHEGQHLPASRTTWQIGTTKVLLTARRTGHLTDEVTLDLLSEDTETHLTLEDGLSTDFLREVFRSHGAL